MDVIELGVPFSDPLADGGTIQRANQKALENGVSLQDCIATVAAARAGGLTVPVVFMGYFNPFLRYGATKLVEDCAAAGVNGFIIVDLPVEHAGVFVAACDTKGLGFTPLVAPTTLDSRLDAISGIARGFVYCVSVLGVTGARTELPVELPAMVDRIRSKVTLPLAVGFGISSREHVEAVGALADGVVVGSAIINAIEKGGVEGLKAFLTAVIPPGRKVAASGGGGGGGAAAASAVAPAAAGASPAAGAAVAAGSATA